MNLSNATIGQLLIPVDDLGRAVQRGREQATMNGFKSSSAESSIDNRAVGVKRIQ